MIHEKIIKELSKKYNLPQFVIDQVTESQFRFTRDMMKDGKFESSRHIFLGEFLVYPGVQAHWNKVNERRKIKENEKTNPNPSNPV